MLSQSISSTLRPTPPFSSQQGPFILGASFILLLTAVQNIFFRIVNFMGTSGEDDREGME